MDKLAPHSHGEGDKLRSNGAPVDAVTFSSPITRGLYFLIKPIPSLIIPQ